MNPLKSVKFGLLTGTLVSVLTTLIATAWEWLESPAGIYHGPDGTNWGFVLDTAISWLIPTLVAATLIALAVHLLVSAVRQWMTRRGD